LNLVFELAGVAYGSHLVPDTGAFTEALKKRKMNVTGKTQLNVWKRLWRKGWKSWRLLHLGEKVA
jgi:hypothetical protein